MTTDHQLRTVPAFALSGGRLDELELLAGGLFLPADGYCLPAAVPEGWPASFELEVPPGVGLEAMLHGVLLLTDPDGTPLAQLAVVASEPSRDKDTVHLAGTLSRLRSAEHPPARALRITAPLVAMAGGRPATVAAVFAKTPLPWQLAAAMTAAHDAEAVLWLIAVCGPQPHGRYTVLPLLHELESARSRIHQARTGLLVMPADAANGSAIDRRLLRHALDHLGVGSVLDFAMEPEPPCTHGGSPATGSVVLLTGLSGSGKSTVARALAESIQQEWGGPVTLLDGDDVRRMLSPGLGFSKEERDANIRRIGWVAALISSAGGTAICAPIAPFDVTRQQVRQMAEEVGRFILVHISTPLPECESRDRKGLYARARRGEIKDFTGIDSPYEYPDDADLHLDTSRMDVKEAVGLIRQCLSANRSGAAPRATLPA